MRQTRANAKAALTFTQKMKCGCREANLANLAIAKEHQGLVVPYPHALPAWAGSMKSLWPMLLHQNNGLLPHAVLDLEKWHCSQLPSMPSWLQKWQSQVLLISDLDNTYCELPARLNRADDYFLVNGRPPLPQGFRDAGRMGTRSRAVSKQSPKSFQTDCLADLSKPSVSWTLGI